MAGEEKLLKEHRFCMLLKLSWYKFKLQYYNFKILTIIPMVTTKKIAIEYTLSLSSPKCLQPEMF
jgi:hypothetical protein